ncbi:hypothetical protein HWI79_1563 [Cryptosporidium felis]|nr:hypothetical protein HWI79_1563 [Cryptosporidium felis]
MYTRLYKIISIDIKEILSMFRFSPISNSPICSISKLNDSPQGNFFRTKFGQDKVLNLRNRIDEESSRHFERNQEYSCSNSPMIKLLEEKKGEIKRNIESLSTQIKRQMHQIEYIDSRIRELRGEKIEIQNPRPGIGLRLEPELYQTGLSRISTTVETGINTPNNELANSNKVVITRQASPQKMDGDWIILPDFKEIISRIVNSHSEN